MTNLSKTSKKRNRGINSQLPNQIIAYTDASCKNNSLGYSFIVLNYKRNKILNIQTFRSDSNCNSHEGELTAILELLKWHKVSNQKSNSLKIYSDSKYVVNGFNTKMEAWVKNKWKNNIKNKDIWMDIYHLRRGVSLSWVKGHGSDAWNILADYLSSSDAILQFNNL